MTQQPPPDPVPERFAGYRTSRFVAISAALHLAAAGAFGVFGEAAWKPTLDITWLDLDNKLGAPVAPAEPAPPKDEQKPDRTEDRAKKEQSKTAAVSKAAARKKRKKKIAARRPRGDRAAQRPRGPFTTRKVALTRLAPGNAALLLLLRMDRIRQSKHGDAVRRLLEVFYDYKTLLWSQQIDPIRDLEAMLIATPNPYRVTETFIVMRHRMPTRRLRLALEESVRFKNQRMRWRRGPAGLRGTIPSPPKLPQDDRVVILRPGLALLAKPEHERLLAPRNEPRQEAASREPADSEQPTLLDALDEMQLEGGEGLKESRRGSRPLPGLLLQAINLPRLVRLPPDVPPPQNLQVTIPATESALVQGVLSFHSAGVAKRFLVAIAPRLARARRSILLRLMGIGRLLERLQLKRVGAQVEAEVKLDGDEVRDLLDLFRSAIPQVRVPGMPPRVPPDAGRTRLDAGAGRTTGLDASTAPAAATSPDASVSAGGPDAALPAKPEPTTDTSVPAVRPDASAAGASP